MKTLVTGNLGYIGSVLMTYLESFKGNNVIGLDSGWYKNRKLIDSKDPSNQIIKDIRDVSAKELEGIDCVIHMASLSNDPLGELDPKITNEINYQSTVKLAKLSKKCGVNRFVYLSSLSMYGISNKDEELDEYNSDKNPVTEYAKTKWQAEQEIILMNSYEFNVVALRPSTVFGASPRLRSDIVFNNLVACAYTTKKIEIKSNGLAWRPVVHIKDVCVAINAAMTAPKNLISGKSFNVGIKNGNYTIKEMALVVQKVIPESEIIFTNKHGSDTRTYKISFKRILNDLGEYYKPKWDLEKGAKELYNFFKKINFKEKDFRGSMTNRLMSLKEDINFIYDKNLRLKQ